MDKEDDTEDKQLIVEFFLTETIYPQELGEVQFTFKPVFFDDTHDGDLFVLGGTVEYRITDNIVAEAS